MADDRLESHPPSLVVTKSSGSSLSEKKELSVGTWRLALVVGSLWLGTMIVAVDNTILGTAIPEISSQFQSIQDVGFYGTAYLLPITATQPTFGRIFKFFHPKWVYLFSILIFEAGSTLCAAAPTSGAFIAGRAVAGIGAAGLFQGALTIVGLVVPLQKRPLCLAIIVSAFGIALAFGPPLGGVLTDRISWRWCFWINLPIGGFVSVLITLLLKISDAPMEDRRLPIKTKIMKLDLLGGTIIIGTITCLLLAIQWGGSTFAWNSSQIIGLFVGFGLLLVIFIVLQWKLGEEATIPYRFLRQRSVLTGSLVICFSQGASMIFAYYLPFYFQATQNVSAIESGVRFLAHVIPQIVGLVLSGAIATATGYYVPFIVGGQTLAVVGIGLMITLSIGSTTVQWASYLVISGFGIGIAVQLPYTALQVVLSDVDLPMGNAIMTFFSQLGGTISVGVAQSIFIHSLTDQISANTAAVSPETVLAVGATELQTLSLQPADLHAVQSAFSDSVANTTIFALAISCVAVPLAAAMEWRNVKTAAKERSTYSSVNSSRKDGRAA